MDRSGITGGGVFYASEGGCGAASSEREVPLLYRAIRARRPAAHLVSHAGGKPDDRRGRTCRVDADPFPDRERSVATGAQADRRKAADAGRVGLDPDRHCGVVGGNDRGLIRTTKSPLSERALL